MCWRGFLTPYNAHLFAVAGLKWSDVKVKKSLNNQLSDDVSPASVADDKKTDKFIYNKILKEKKSLNNELCDDVSPASVADETKCENLLGSKVLAPIMLASSLPRQPFFKKQTNNRRV